MIFFIVVATNGEGRSLSQQHNSSGCNVMARIFLVGRKKRGKSFDFGEYQVIELGITTVSSNATIDSHGIIVERDYR
jgi:hypothetical protein